MRGYIYAHVPGVGTIFGNPNNQSKRIEDAMGGYGGMNLSIPGGDFE